MRSWLAGLRRLVIPWGAGPDSPAIVLGDAIPAELVTRYAGSTVVGVIILRLDGDTYVYQALVIDLGVIPKLAVGTVVQGLVTEHYTIDQTFGNPGAFRIAEADSVDVFYAGQSIVESTSWTPTWEQGGTAITIGAGGSSAGRYLKQGELTFAYWRLIVGGAGTVWPNPGQPLAVDLPFPSTEFDVQSVNGYIRDASLAGNRGPVSANINITTDRIDAIWSYAGGAVTEAAPFALAVSDRIILEGTFISTPP